MTGRVPDTINGCKIVGRIPLSIGRHCTSDSPTGIDEWVIMFYREEPNDFGTAHYNGGAWGSGATWNHGHYDMTVTEAIDDLIERAKRR